MKRLEHLLGFIKTNKSKNEPLIELFDRYAKLNNLNKYSVRNLYYYGLNKLESKGENVEHERKKIIKFTKQQSDELIEYIENNKLKGVSVRSSCMILANGDRKKCIRYINKYRLEKRKTNYEGKDNIVKFVPKNTLSDNDIASLFSGLVKLVKDNAVKQAGVSADEMREIKQGLSQANDEINSLRSLLRKEKDRNEWLLNKLNNNHEKSKAILRVD